MLGDTSLGIQILLFHLGAQSDILPKNNWIIFEDFVFDEVLMRLKVPYHALSFVKSSAKFPPASEQIAPRLSVLRQGGYNDCGG